MTFNHPRPNMTTPLLLAQADHEAALSAVAEANDRRDAAERALYAAVRDELLTHFNPAFVWSEGMQANSREVYLRCAWDADRSDWRATIRTTVGDEDRRTTFEWAQRGPDPKAAVEAVLFAAYLDIGGEGLAVDTDDLLKIERVIWRDPSKPYVKPAPPNSDPPFCIHCPGEGVHKMSCTASKNGYVAPYEPCRVPLSTLSAKYHARVTVPVQEVK